MSRKPGYLSSFCLLAILIWLIGAALVGWWFIQGHTKPGTDGRTAILLSEGERDLILEEMRDLLKAVRGIVQGLGDADPVEGRKLAEQAARSGGMGMAADVNPALMLKLPVVFKQMGMTVHRDLDNLGDQIAQGAGIQDILNDLSALMTRCVSCHDTFRLTAGEPSTE